MGIDASIYGQIKPLELPNPLTQYSQIAALQQAQSQNRLADLVFGEKQREVEDSRALNEVYKLALGADGSLDRAKLLSGAAQRGLGAKIPGLTKSLAEQDKAQADLTNARTQATERAAKTYREMLSNVKDPATAQQWLAAQYADPALKDVMQRFGPLEESVSRIPTDPQGFGEWLEKQAVGMDKFIEARRPKAERSDLGGMVQVIDLNPQSPTFGKVLKQDAKTMTPGEVATDRRAGAQLAQSERHHRENLAATNGKAPAGYRWSADNSKLEPIPGGPAEKDKAPTEFQGKAAMFGARAEAADKVLNTLESQGVTTPGVIKGVVSGIGGMVPFVGDKVSSGLDSVMNAAPAVLGGPNAKQQQVEQARRDFVNAVLRLESGASISASEFENASKQYFPQPGDSKEVIAQKARNRRLAIEGLKTNAGKTVVKAPAGKGPEDIRKAADEILGL